MRSKYTAEEKQKLVEQYRQGNLTLQGFAAENGIKAETFKGWVYANNQDEKNESPKKNFVEIKTRNASKAEIITVRKSGIEIEIPVMSDKKALKEILSAVAEL